MKIRSIYKCSKYLFLIILSFVACKKTSQVSSEKKILEYKISSVPLGEKEIYGQIDENAKTITVHLPLSYGLKVFTPEIKISDGATITPGSNKTIVDLISRVREKKTIIHTVTGRDGSTVDYQVITKSDAMNFTIDELSASSSQISEYHLEEYPSLGSSFVLNIKGKDLLSIGHLCAAVLVHSSGYKIYSNSVYINSQIDRQVHFTIPKGEDFKNTPSGEYKLIYYEYLGSYELKNPIRLNK